jgi:DNA-binding response OmpR family regulator
MVLQWRPLTEAPVPESAPYSVLVVDDDVLVRATVGDYLRESGFRVVEAADVLSAREALALEHVDAVFSDVCLPGDEDGFSLAAWIRQHRPDLPVLLTSGGFRPRPKPVSGPQPEVLLKPFSFARLVERLEAMAAERRSAAAVD